MSHRSVDHHMRQCVKIYYIYPEIGVKAADGQRTAIRYRQPASTPLSHTLPPART
jgi:hypothetical protein